MQQMQCPTPISIRDKSEKNPFNKSHVRQIVPCGRCGICKKNKRNEWSFRLREQLKDSINCRFITLTYAEHALPYNEQTGEITLCKEHLQLFIKRLREYEFRRTHKRRIRYYAIGEYGSKTRRPHYHAIIFNLSKHGSDNIPHIWKYGHTDIGTVTAASIHYVTKYHVNRNTYKQDDLDKQPEFSMMSQKIGYGYIERNKKYHLETGNTFCYMDGYKINMPRIFKEKIFDSAQIKAYGERNVENAQEANRKEAERLEKLGHDDGYYEIFKRSIKKASKIKSKNNDNDKI